MTVNSQPYWDKNISSEHETHTAKFFKCFYLSLLILRHQLPACTG